MTISFNKIKSTCMTKAVLPLYKLLLTTLLVLQSIEIVADANSAQVAMENSANPLLLLSSSKGDIYLELFPAEAPNNVANFIALAEGASENDSEEPLLQSSRSPQHFDGVRFHRVIPEFIIQAASPSYHILGAPDEVLSDEINANVLGLDQMLVLNPDGSFHEYLNIEGKADYESRILKPLYEKMGILSNTQVQERQYEILEALQKLTVKAAYENQGYEYSNRLASHSVNRGIIALTNTGPNSNGPEFFISLVDANWLTGKYTVIGKVVEGMEVADIIGETAIDAARYSSLSTVIYSIRQIN
jgi:cyclophilin family peptidyl-prolyl cis-trans isomerase